MSEAKEIHPIQWGFGASPDIIDFAPQVVSADFPEAEPEPEAPKADALEDAALRDLIPTEDGTLPEQTKLVPPILPEAPILVPPILHEPLIPPSPNIPPPR